MRGPTASSRAVGLAVAVILVVAVFALAIHGVGEHHPVLEPLLLLGPLIAVTRARPAQVAAVGVLAVLTGLAVIVIDGHLGDVDHLLGLAAVAAGSALAVGAAAVQHHLSGVVAQRGAELDAERTARHRADLLARSAELLEAPLEPATMLARIAGLPVPDHADLSIVDLQQADGRLRGAVAKAADPTVAASLRELRERFPLDPAGPHPVAVALRTATPQLLPWMSDEQLAEIATNDDHLALMRAARYRSALVLPLTARGRTFGALSLLRFGDATPFTEEDLRLGVALARHAAMGLDNARLFRDLQTTEERLEAIVDNLAEAVTAFTPDGELLFANRAAAELIGEPSPEAVVSGGLERLRTRWRFLDEHGQQIPYERQPLAIAARGETAEPLLVHAVERGTGIDRWVVHRAAAIPGPDGRARLIVHVAEDVTAVKRQEQRERLLSTASKLVSSSLDVPATLDKAAWAVVPELADWARIDLPDERGMLRQAAVAHRDLGRVELLDEWRRDYPPRPEDHRGPWEVLRTGKPVVWDRVDPEDVARYAQAPHHAELMRLIDTRSMIIVPLLAGERVIGTMQLATTSASDRLLGERDVELAQELARRAAIAVVNAHVHAERTHIATTLQKSLLPPRLPVIPGLTVAARFRALGAAADVGGDFYDLFPGRDGWTVLIGDVTGKGPEAAAITSLARYTMRTVAQYEADPCAMVRRLNAALTAEPGHRQILTAACVVVGEADGGGALPLGLVRAGHPPPLLVTAAGEVRPVGRSGTLLGAFEEGSWTVERLALQPGDALVLYTDGVTDTRGDGDRFGSERLVALLKHLGPAGADAIAQRIDEALLAFGEQRDDVAVLVLEATGRDAPADAVMVSRDDSAR
ncbi:MAG TPA: SpoIIE family protein phosphatase [Baekduia sp.]|nr:SpoIIE family protein phosphatase [Baekduia sp.]